MVGIHAIGGMAGVGKTTFAVHVAHRLAPRFPDGQIFLPLHGHTPGRRPVDPPDALASLLQVAGVTAQQIPPGLEARTALWRDRLAGKQLLLVLDDAVDSEQVRPLLPGTAGSLVLVTSRRHLTALEDATAISLDTLPPGEATSLLIRLVDRPGLTGDEPAVAELSRICGYLPLALNDLGILRYLTGDYQIAAETLETALTIYRDLGDRLGQANSRHSLGSTLRRTADYAGAAQALEKAPLPPLTLECGRAGTGLQAAATLNKSCPSQRSWRSCEYVRS